MHLNLAAVFVIYTEKYTISQRGTFHQALFLSSEKARVSEVRRKSVAPSPGLFVF